jgi:hypothetical protein
MLAMGAGIAVAQAVVVGEHALGKAGISAALYFDVDIDPAFLAVDEGDTCQCVGKAFAQLGIAYDLAQFNIFEFVALRSVYLGAGFGKVEVHELGEGVFKNVFPGAVVFVSGRGLWVCHGFGLTNPAPAKAGLLSIRFALRL